MSERSFSRLLRQHAARTPDLVALQIEDQASLTYGAWHARSLALASDLAGRGLGPRARVGLLFDNADHLDYAIAYLAVLRAGAAAVPLSRGLADPEIAELARRARLTALLRPADVVAPAGPVGPLASVGPEDLAEVLFTSGTTGPPKAVAVSHANLEGEIALDRLTHRDAGLQLHAIPVGTNWGQFVLRSALSAGIRSIVMPRFDPRRALELVERHRPVELLLVPPMALLLLAAAQPARFDLSSVRTIRLSAAPVSGDTLFELRRLFGSATVQVAYSSTEAAPASTLMRFPPDPPDTVGRAAEGGAVRVVDPDGAVLPPGQVGDVELRAPPSPRRYLDSDEPGDEWIRMGDLGSLDEHGYLRLRGRHEDVVNVGGAKVFCPEVEAALIRHPAVVDAAAFAIESEPIGQLVAAAVVVSTPVPGPSLRAFARARLAEHKVPARIVVVDELPMTAAGKVSRRELQRRLGGPVPAGDVDVEHRLLELWREVLQRDDLDADDDLLDHGAGSLAAFAVLARLEETTGATVPPSRFLVLPTVRDQARMIEALATG